MSRARHNKSTRYYVYSALLHLVFVALIGVSLQWVPEPTPLARNEEEIVAAVAIDESQVKKELQKLKDIEERKRRKEESRQKKLDDRARAAQEKRKKEEERLKKVKEQKAQQEKARKAEEEKKRKAAEELQKLRAKQDAEEKHLQELAAIKAAEEEARMLEDLARKEQADLKKKQEAAQQKRIEGKVNEHISLIRRKVQSNWIQPGAFQAGSQCTIKVKLIPSGEIVDMRVSNCRGGPVFQRSVELAVRKSSPLPVPSDPAVFNAMRDIEFVFKPEV